MNFLKISIYLQTLGRMTRPRMPVGYHQYPPYQHEQLVQSGHPGPHHAQNTYVSLQSDLGEEHYSSLAFNAAVLAMNSDPNNNNGMTASSSKNLDLCHCEDKVCQVEGGVKFNPFYVREMRRREDAPPTTRKKRMGSSSALCDVLMDSVVHSSHVAAAHAEQANCMQCREFVHKFRNDVRDMINTEKEIYERQVLLNFLILKLRLFHAFCKLVAIFFCLKLTCCCYC